METITPSLIAALAEAALDEKTAVTVPNRAERRRLGGYTGYYRQPRTTPKGTGTANHWLARQREEEAFAAAQRSTAALR